MLQFRQVWGVGEAAMTYEYRGSLDLERAHARRWVSIIAVVIPVAAFVLLGSWFIRAYVAPPTVDVPNSMMTAAAPPTAAPPLRVQTETIRPQPPQVATRTEVEAPMPAPPQTVARAPADTARPVVAEPAAPPPAQEQIAERSTERTEQRTEQRPEFASALPMLATLTVAPPSLGSTVPGYADPAQDAAPAAAPAEVTAVTAENDALEPSEPIAGPIPMPKKKPHARVALFTGAVPLPRPRPADALPPPDLPAVDRHAIE
jgi:type IV secretory pathway VirB10-like protein